MTTKEYLWQIKDTKNRVKEKQAQIDSMRSALVNISPKVSDERVSSSSDPDKMGTMIANILERESELKERIEIFLAKEKEISNQIDSLPNFRQREVLHWRYVEDKKFEDIAVNCMDISFRHVMRLHKKALRSFEEIYGELYL